MGQGGQKTVNMKRHYTPTRRSVRDGRTDYQAAGTQAWAQGLGSGPAAVPQSFSRAFLWGMRTCSISHHSWGQGMIKRARMQGGCWPRPEWGQTPPAQPLPIQQDPTNSTSPRETFAGGAECPLTSHYVHTISDHLTALTVYFNYFIIV